MKPETQLRARPPGSGQSARHAEPVRLRAACGPGLRVRPVAARPGARRHPAQVLRDPGLPHGVVLLPQLDRPVRDRVEEAPATARSRGGRVRPLMTQPARHPARDRLLVQRPSAGVRYGQSMTASWPLPDDSPPRIPSQQPSDHPATGSNGANKRSQIPPRTSQSPHSENRWPRPSR